MSNLIHIDKDYKQWIQSLSHRFRQSQIKASVHVNQEMLRFYWELGSEIVALNVEERWGEGIMQSISQDLKDALPGVSGLSPTNLYYCKKWFLTYYQEFINLQQPVVKKCLSHFRVKFTTTRCKNSRSVNWRNRNTL